MRITVLALFLVIPLTLSGCGVVQQAELAKAKAHLSAELADCLAQHPGRYAERADCFTAAEDETVRPFAGNGGDLLSLKQAQRKVLAAKVDRGEMTADDAKLAYAQFVTSVHDEAQRRRNADSAVAAQQRAAAAQMLGGASALMLGASRPAPAPMVNTTCMPVGSFVNCQSY